MSTMGREEVRRLEYRGHVLVETLLPTALSYGPAKFARWEIVKTNADGTENLVGYENSEAFARLVVDYILDGNAKLSFENIE